MKKVLISLLICFSVFAKIGPVFISIADISENNINNSQENLNAYNYYSKRQIRFTTDSEIEIINRKEYQLKGAVYPRITYYYSEFIINNTYVLIDDIKPRHLYKWIYVDETNNKSIFATTRNKIIIFLINRDRQDARSVIQNTNSMYNALSNIPNISFNNTLYLKYDIKFFTDSENIIEYSPHEVYDTWKKLIFNTKFKIKNLETILPQQKEIYNHLILMEKEINEKFFPQKPKEESIKIEKNIDEKKFQDELNKLKKEYEDKISRIKNDTQNELENDHKEYLKNLDKINENHQNEIENLIFKHNAEIKKIKIDNEQAIKKLKQNLEIRLILTESAFKTYKTQKEEETEILEKNIAEYKNIKYEYDNLKWTYDKEREGWQNDMDVLRQEIHDLNKELKELKKNK